MRFLAVLMRRSHKPPGRSAIEWDKGLVCTRQAARLQTAQQAAQSLLEAEVPHGDKGIKQVETNGANLLHDGLPLPLGSRPFRKHGHKAPECEGTHAPGARQLSTATAQPPQRIGDRALPRWRVRRLWRASILA